MTTNPLWLRSFSALAGAALLPMPAAAQPAPPPSPAAAPPSQSACPAVANVDLRRIPRQLAREARGRMVINEDRLAVVAIPPTASRRPPPDATFIARVRLPGGGLHSADERAVVWREADGSWWGWRQVLNANPVSPPPPPEPGSPEAEQDERDRAAGREYWETFPPYEGRLDAEQSAHMEAAFADPCRQLEPDFWPLEIPLLERVDGRRVERCQVYQDSTVYHAEFTEAGRPPRRIGMRCGGAGTLNASIITWAAHVGLPRNPPRRLTREEVQATWQE